MQQAANTNQYDYIVIGSGAAGLSLLMHIVDHPELLQKQVLVLDRSEKKDNDRTWCFWQEEKSKYEAAIFKIWDKLTVNTTNYSTTQYIAPYTYKMLRGIDFYNHCKNQLAQYSNIKFVIDDVKAIRNVSNHIEVETTKNIYTSRYAFCSTLLQEPMLSTKQDYLLQHFKGLIIETSTPFFDANTATYMDFTINQQHGTSFVYVLPLSNKKALVEYTLFTATELTTEEYDKGLNDYISQNLKIADYKTLEVEQGIIPMTDYKFPTHDKNIIFIGTAGGCTRPSTGYTFTYIQRQATALAAALAENKEISASILMPISKKSRFYDAVFLGVLSKNNKQFADYFSMLFAKTKIINVLRFLDDKSNFWNDIKIILAMPKWPFIKSLWRKML
jgi:lycopene beta-cyclase